METISPTNRSMSESTRPFGFNWSTIRCRSLSISSIFWALSENLTERPLLRNFLHPLNREELDVGHRHPLGLQQQIPQVLIPAAAVDQHTDVPVHRFYHSEANLRPAVVHNAFDVFEQHVGELLERRQPLPLQLVHPLLQIVEHRPGISVVP